MDSLNAILNSLSVYISSEIKDRDALGISFLSYRLRHPTSHLERFKNIHRGEKCFVVGTGPSLKVEDIELLKGQVCFGVNTLFKIFNNTSWRPDYYCVIDPRTYSNIRKQLCENNVCNVFIAQNRMKEGFDEKNSIPFNLECSSFYKIGLKNHLKTMKFSGDIVRQVYDGASVVFAALQIAVYMGFSSIYLLGTDCNYDTNVLHASELGYSKDYNYNWTKQTGLTMIEGFKVASEYAKKHGIKVYNATRGGMLEVFPRVNLEDIVGENDA